MPYNFGSFMSPLMWVCEMDSAPVNSLPAGRETVVNRHCDPGVAILNRNWCAHVGNLSITTQQTFQSPPSDYTCLKDHINSFNF